MSKTAFQFTAFNCMYLNLLDYSQLSSWSENTGHVSSCRWAWRQKNFNFPCKFPCTFHPSCTFLFFLNINAQAVKSFLTMPGIVDGILALLPYYYDRKHSCSVLKTVCIFVLENLLIAINRWWCSYWFYVDGHAGNVFRACTIVASLGCKCMNLINVKFLTCGLCLRCSLFDIMLYVCDMISVYSSEKGF